MDEIQTFKGMLLLIIWLINFVVTMSLGVMIKANEVSKLDCQKPEHKEWKQLLMLFLSLGCFCGTVYVVFDL